MALIPVILLGSGTALTVCGLALIVGYGAKAPVAALVLLLAGFLDGVVGSVWTTAILFSRRADPADETGRKLVLAGGLLSVIFLGAVLALLLYLHVIVGCLGSWHIL
jgi:hypothetical protein